MGGDENILNKYTERVHKLLSLLKPAVMRSWPRQY